ncbi:hypothetical protein AJ79_02995 [Helicocarpus griseus UAMH5409]|uniref:DUF7770 domain-containing protein n=1 Tax=Helicocarpus griseus UAMH5409 TaxID=1447875 RepID=A0A2B7Y0W0_9EURO|nr:hypothetical protein AJ79_02995 [Helicocarpus griseus UAMH5409]
MNFPRPLFIPLKYVPAAPKETILSYPVSCANAVAHERLPNGGNHWCIYLSISLPEPESTSTPNKEGQSVSINCSPSYSEPATAKSSNGGSKAIVLVSHHETPFSAWAAKSVRLDVIKHAPGNGSRGDSARVLTVRDFVTLLEEEGRHLYEFDAEGRGCRFWTEDQVGLFYERGLVVDGVQVEEVREARTEFPGGRRYPLVVGDYYVEGV